MSGQLSLRRPPNRRRARFLLRRPFGPLILLAVIIVAALAGLAAATGFLGQDAFNFLAPEGEPRPFAALYLSGDMGLRFGLGRHVAPALAAHGIPVMGMNSPALFAQHRTRKEVEDIVADGVRQAMRQTGAERIVLIGQSFGSDMIATALPSFPDDLRPHVAAVVLVVPGQNAYFQADPLGFAYRGAPDARPGAALRTVAWTPLVCIRGAQERDSLCPELAGTAARQITLPGGHLLQMNYRRLIATILSELDSRDGTAAGTEAIVARQQRQALS